jgi:hypothetical protein
VAAFRSLGEEAIEASGLELASCSADGEAYARYREWLPFHRRRHTFLGRVSRALGYPVGEIFARAGVPATPPAGISPITIMARMRSASGDSRAPGCTRENRPFVGR